ncbi:hypothetical protein KCV00_g221, partial [Aureobasidium melanogenum]
MTSSSRPSQIRQCGAAKLYHLEISCRKRLSGSGSDALQIPVQEPIELLEIATRSKGDISDVGKVQRRNTWLKMLIQGLFQSQTQGSQRLQVESLQAVCRTGRHLGPAFAQLTAVNADLEVLCSTETPEEPQTRQFRNATSEDVQTTVERQDSYHISAWSRWVLAEMSLSQWRDVLGASPLIGSSR